MKTRFVLFLTLVFVLLISCNKAEEDVANQPQEHTSLVVDKETEGEEAINLVIQGELIEMTPDTKSAAQTVSRIIWSGGESVYAYIFRWETEYDDEGEPTDQPQAIYVGTLTAEVVDGTEGRVATLSGTISSAPSDGKLFLVHSPLLKDIPTRTHSCIDISLETQSGDNIPFVAYAVVDYNDQTISNLKTRFTYASSVLFANVSGLRRDGRAVWEANIVGINTVCRIRLADEGNVYVTGESKGTISRKWYFAEAYANEKCNMGIYFAIPPSSSNSSRYLEIVQDADPSESRNLIGGKFATAALSSGKTYLTQQNCYNGAYIEGSYKGQGFFDAYSGVWWAPVNCGYSSSSTSGMLYQWCRKLPISASTTPSYLTYQASTIADGNDESTRGKFYKGNACWHSESYNREWKREYDPCPNGWRVPSVNDWGLLFYRNGWDRTNRTGYIYGSYSSGSWDFGNGFVLSRPGSYRSSSGEVSSTGKYWTSDTDNQYSTAITIYFYQFSKDYQYSNSIFDSWGRSYAYNVRCVHD